MSIPAGCREAEGRHREQRVIRRSRWRQSQLYRGRDAIEMTLRRVVLDGTRSWRMLPTSAKG
jgi:hypothetical protein